VCDTDPPFKVSRRMNFFRGRACVDDDILVDKNRLRSFRLMEELSPRLSANRPQQMRRFRYVPFQFPVRKPSTSLIDGRAYVSYGCLPSSGLQEW